MFGNDASVFENVEPGHRPDVASTAPPPTHGMGASPDGLGGSPDGLGAFPRRPPPASAGVGAYAVPTASDVPPSVFSNPTPVMGTSGYAVPVDGMGGKVDWLEPPDASPQAALRTAGITALTAAVFFGGGLALGGPWGGMSGLLLSGSGFNVYRAQKWWGSPDASEKYEAVVSAFFAVAGLAAGCYAGYKAYDSKR